jgi:hypothetical protein
MLYVGYVSSCMYDMMESHALLMCTIAVVYCSVVVI